MLNWGLVGSFLGPLSYKQGGLNVIQCSSIDWYSVLENFFFPEILMEQQSTIEINQATLNTHSIKFRVEMFFPKQTAVI